MENLPEQTQDELLVKATEGLIKQIYIGTLEAMPEQAQEEYLQMLESNIEQEKIDEFLRVKISDYDKMVEKIVAKFKERIRAVEIN